MLLLEDVDELMGEQPVVFLTARSAVSIEYDVMADGVGERVHPAGRIRRACIAVNSHMTEVVAEPQLEVVSRTWVQRPAGRVQHLMNNGGGIARWWSQISGFPMNGFLFVAARGFTRSHEITFLLQRWGFDFYLGKRP